MKHISHETKCKTLLSEKELQTFKDQAATRKKLKRSIRDKLFGDPNERAKRRKELYNPEKRKEAYQQKVQQLLDFKGKQGHESEYLVIGVVSDP